VATGPGQWFKSNKFRIRSGEDEEINPDTYGIELAEYIKEGMIKIGYEFDEILAEDFCWCVFFKLENLHVWVGCGSLTDEGSDYEYEPNNPPKVEDVSWHVFPVVEVPILPLGPWLKSLLGIHEVKPTLLKLEKDLKKVLESIEDIQFIDDQIQSGREG
jgi:hypothetical protein